MIRGQLSGGFEQRSMVGHAYQQCTACSPAVLQALQARGTAFVLDALQVRPGPCLLGVELCCSQLICGMVPWPARSWHCNMQ